jgi:hypothetical protein
MCTDTTLEQLPDQTLWNEYVEKHCSLGLIMACAFVRTLHNPKLW